MVLFTTHCSRCLALEALLKSKDVPYDVCEDVSKMQELGFSSAPVLEVDGQYLPYGAAMKYVMEEL